MNAKIVFDYFYGQESEMHTFYRIPKLLFDNSYFMDMTNDAKILYGLMLDRMSLSQKNKWFDEQNRAFILFSQTEAMNLIKCKKNKAISLFRELENIGLVERRKQGQGNPDRLYLKDFVERDTEKNQRLEKSTSEQDEKVSEVGKINRLENQTSSSWKNQPLEVGKSNPNYNNINNTNKVILTNHISSIEPDANDEYEAYSEIIRENISLDIMLERFPDDKEIIEGIYDLILETVLCKNETTWIAKNQYPTNFVKSKFLKLNNLHLEYVMECMRNNTTKIRNMKNYLRSTLFNAPSTMGSYFQSEVSHDKACGII
ncbi:DUF6017 domain-containing protein [Butyrivibrio sp. WCD3002]|uniref:DUF6017 domain-containing protein n=1 Tax=Butyrivibrio sp. WCD3002 TaxID=1280676 RepID=UPI000412CDF4|nr:DUF6017 domain-containing protein [Butyrivibrio sp. WCD3002]